MAHARAGPGLEEMTRTLKFLQALGKSARAPIITSELFWKHFGNLADMGPGIIWITWITWITTINKAFSFNQPSPMIAHRLTGQPFTNSSKMVSSKSHFPLVGSCVASSGGHHHDFDFQPSKRGYHLFGTGRGSFPLVPFLVISVFFGFFGVFSPPSLVLFPFRYLAPFAVIVAPGTNSRLGMCSAWKLTTFWEARFKLLCERDLHCEIASRPLIPPSLKGPNTRYFLRLGVGGRVIVLKHEVRERSNGCLWIITLGGHDARCKADAMRCDVGGAYPNATTQKKSGGYATGKDGS